MQGSTPQLVMIPIPRISGPLVGYFPSNEEPSNRTSLQQATLSRVDWRSTFRLQVMRIAQGTFLVTRLNNYSDVLCCTRPLHYIVLPTLWIYGIPYIR